MTCECCARPIEGKPFEMLVYETVDGVVKVKERHLYCQGCRVIMESEWKQVESRPTRVVDSARKLVSWRRSKRRAGMSLSELRRFQFEKSRGIRTDRRKW